MSRVGGRPVDGHGSRVPAERVGRGRVERAGQRAAPWAAATGTRTRRRTAGGAPDEGRVRGCASSVSDDSHRPPETSSPRHAARVVLTSPIGGSCPRWSARGLGLDLAQARAEAERHLVAGRGLRPGEQGESAAQRAQRAQQSAVGRSATTSSGRPPSHGGPSGVAQAGCPCRASSTTTPKRSSTSGGRLQSKPAVRTECPRHSSVSAMSSRPGPSGPSTRMSYALTIIFPSREAAGAGRAGRRWARRCRRGACLAARGGSYPGLRATARYPARPRA